MPAQKRAFDTMEGDPPQRHHGNHHEPPEDGGGYESDRSPSWSNGEKDEFAVVKLAEIRKEVQCPICLGIIRKTRTVMECLHRFCRECIDKSMRLGNNECPACRTHCASRRSLRDDPNYDALIAALYPDIDKYEQEELAFHEEEKTRNRQVVELVPDCQTLSEKMNELHATLVVVSPKKWDAYVVGDRSVVIQASIAQTLRRQSEALGRKKTTAKATAPPFTRRSQGSYRRGRRNHRAADTQGSEDDEANGNDGGKDSSSTDDQSAEVLKPKRSRRWGGVRFSQPSGAANADGGGDENDSEPNRDAMGASAGLVGNSEILAWGKGGMRSHTRYGSLSGGNGKNARSSRLSKLADYLRNLEQNDNELDIHLMLVSLDEQRIPNLQTPYLCCRPTLSVRHLCQYISLQTLLLADEVEILVMKEQLSKLNPLDSTNGSLQILEAQETLAGLKTMCNAKQGHLLLAYRRKLSA